ncbi:hypothetical protein B0H14DRAFT_3439338 [Mycena olivaceomarginata]|nr:hypothetical protein B0H14DRAFT_3439338 [Mycena olivaceomarginata]
MAFTLSSKICMVDCISAYNVAVSGLSSVAYFLWLPTVPVFTVARATEYRHRHDATEHLLIASPSSFPRPPCRPPPFFGFFLLATAITTTASATTAVASQVKNERAPCLASSASPADGADTKSDSLTNHSHAQTTQPKRRTRRPNTAEGRATPNAVEQMRREVLNGCLCVVHAARRHRVGAAQTLRALARDAEVLRRVEDFDLELEESIYLEEHGEYAEKNNENENEGEESPAPVAAKIITPSSPTTTAALCGPAPRPLPRHARQPRPQFRSR